MQTENVPRTRPLRRVVGGFSFRFLGRLFFASIPFWALPAYANPTGGQITAGSGAVIQAGDNTTVNQASQNLSLNWQSFNVGAHESVSFVQPNTAAIAVNRIADTSASQILGSLNANGQVFLINPNGIVFGAGAQVNVGGLVASTLNISDSDLTAATRHFSGDGAGTIVNRGTITTTPGGYVALLGRQVSNQGTISTPGGTAALGAGSAVTLNFDANHMLSMQVDQSMLATLVENKQLIMADGGQVLMSAGAKNSLLASVVNNTGVVQAQTVGNHNGKIVLLAGMAAGSTEVSGTLDASAPNGGDGGFIETSAAHVHVTDAARITTQAVRGGKTGTWLIDPQDYTIAASGGDITGSVLSRNLDNSSVTILSSNGGAAGSGNINVNDVVSWGANTLTLTAANNININAVMTAGGSAGLVLNTATANGADAGVAGGAVKAMPGVGRVDFTGGGNTLSINGNPYTIIDALGVAGSVTGTDLQGLNGNLAGNYALGANIDASATSGWNSGAGFDPIGNSSTSFSGVFDGLGHTISGVTINRSALDRTGLFGSTENSLIRNVGLLSVNITGNSYVGGLVGYNNGGSISNSYATGQVVAGVYYAGGLVGYNRIKGSISSSYAAATVNGYFGTGGLVGYNYESSVNNSYATGQVVGSYWYTGGLLGGNGGNGSVSNSYATGAVSGNFGTGGLVGGSVDNSSISNSYATGQVSGSANDVGGLVGGSYATISNSYATGAVSGNAVNVAGLVGIQYTGSISQSYATGAVSGPNAGGSIGGLVGRKQADSTISNSYWNTQTTGQDHSVGIGVVDADAIGLTSAEMLNASSFAGWDVATTGGSNSVWRIYEGYTAPLLRTFMTNLVTANVTTYTGAAYAGSDAYTFGTLTPTFWLPSSSVDTSLVAGNVYTDVPAINVGSYLLNGDLHSSQMGYDIAFTAGNLTINPATLLFTADSASRLYGAANPIFTGSVTGFVGADTLANATNGTTAFSSVAGTASNAGGYAVNGSGLTANNGNYVFAQAPGNAMALTVSPAPLTATANDISTTYDGAAYGGGNGASYSGFVNGEGTDVLGGALIYGGASQGAKNAGRYAITPSGLTSGNYTISYVDGALTINPATLMFTADPVSRPYGVVDPDFTGSMTGFVGTDTVANATTGTLFWTSPADLTSLPGSYAINGSGLAATNYIFAQAPGNASALTVQARAPVAMTMTTAGLIQNVGSQDWGQGDLDSPDSGQSTLGYTRFALPGQSGYVAPELITIVGTGVRLP